MSMAPMSLALTQQPPIRIAAALLALGLAGYAAFDPRTALLVTVAIIVLAAAALRPDLAFLGVVAAFPFQWSFAADAPGLGSMTKIVGAAAVGGFGLNLLFTRRRIAWYRPYGPLLGFFGCLLFSTTLAVDLGLALSTDLRIVMFAALYLALTQVDDHDGRLARWVALIFAAATAIATLLAIPSYLTSGNARLYPPYGDANDFGAIMACGLILALGVLPSAGQTRSGRIVRAVAFGCAVVLLIAVVLSMSRGSLIAALLGLVALAAGAREFRRWIRRVLMVVLITGAVATAALHSVILEGLARKTNVAGANVDSRLQAWLVGIDLGVAHPLSGIGPGNFGLYTHRLTDTPALAFAVVIAHNVYVDVWVSTGVPGTICFALLLAATLRQAQRAVTDADPATRPLAVAVRAALLTILVASIFSTQLFNESLWILLALPLVLSRRPGTSHPTNRQEINR